MFIQSKHLLFNSKNLFSTKTLQSSLFNNGNTLFSKSKNIFTNLSIEDWIYRNVDLSNKKILLLWLNNESMVIGRHQNPWCECNVHYCKNNNIEIVRRNSGGGTVYHDLGNLNICFLSAKSLYNRRNNLSVIRDALNNGFNIDCEISDREDLVVRQKQTAYKISGSASKLGSTNAYHHCTLLVDVNMNNMRNAIKNVNHSNTIIESKATKSVSSPTVNLKYLNNQIEMENIIQEISIQFFKHQTGDANNYRGIFEIESNSNLFAGIDEIGESYKSWKWIYGKTPRFTINRVFMSANTKNDNWIQHNIIIEVFHGLIEKVTTHPFELEFNSSLIGVKFTQQTVRNKINQLLINTSNYYDCNKFLCDCIIKCIDEAY